MLSLFKRVVGLEVVHVVLLIFLTILLFKPIIFNPGYPSWSDNANYPVLNMDRYGDISNFSYSDKHSGLVYNSNILLTEFFANKLALILNHYISDQRNLSVVWVIFPYIVMSISMYISIKNVIGKSKISFLLTTLYIFSLVGLTNVSSGWVTTSYSQAGGLLFLSFFVRYLRERNLKDIFIMSFVSLASFTNIANMYGNLIVCFFMLAIWVLLYGKSLKETLYLYRHLLLLPLLVAAMNFYWLLPLPFMSRQAGFSFDLKNIYSSDSYTFINTFNFVSNFSLFKPAQEVFGFFNSGLYRTLFTIFLVSVIYSASLKLRGDKFLVFLFTGYLLLFVLSMGDRVSLMWDLLQQLPTSFLIRSPQLKFYTTEFFFLSTIAGYLIANYRTRELLYIISALIFVGAVDFSKGKIFSHWSNISIPDDYIEIVYYLSREDNKHETVMKFPPTNGGPRLKWRDDIYTYPILDSMLYNPIVVRTWGDSMVPIYLRDVYHDSSLESSERLGDGGVRYVLVHKDYSNFPVKRDFKEDLGLEPVVSGDNVDLYRVSDEFYKPLFYSDDASFLTYKRINPVMHVVYASPGNLVTFNRQHDVSLKLYDNKDVEESGYYRCNFSIGDLNFCDVLLLKIKPLPKQPLDRDYKNNWILPENSSGSYVVYYEPQMYFYIGLVVSFMALILHILYLLKLGIDDRKEHLVLD